MMVFLPICTAELAGSESDGVLEEFSEVVGDQEGLEVFLQVRMSLEVELHDGGSLQGSVYALDLAVRPWMVDPDEAVLDVICHADAVEDVLADVAAPLVVAELDVAAGEDGMARVRYLGDVHLEVPGRMGLELLLPRSLVAFDPRQTADAMTLHASDGRDEGEEDGGLKSIETTVIQWKQRVLAEGQRYELPVQRSGQGSRACSSPIGAS